MVAYVHFFFCEHYFFKSSSKYQSCQIGWNVGWNKKLNKRSNTHGQTFDQMLDEMLASNIWSNVGWNVWSCVGPLRLDAKKAEEGVQ